jgi:transposase-like protein
VRTVDFEDGSARVRIPRLRCRCGGNVHAELWPVPERHRRHRYDLCLVGMNLIATGMSPQVAQRHLRDRGASIG